MTHAERRAYQRGYNAAASRRWALTGPPEPPAEWAAKALRALQRSRDAMKDYFCIIEASGLLFEHEMQDAIEECNRVIDDLAEVVTTEGSRGAATRKDAGADGHRCAAKIARAALNQDGGE